MSQVNITPDLPLWMAGYASRDHPAEGKLTELWAKALWLEDAHGSAAVLITLDLIGLDRALAASLCRRLQQEYGLQRDQVALCPSHTHSGPVVAQNLRPLHLEQLDEQQRTWIHQYAQAWKRTWFGWWDRRGPDDKQVLLTWGNGQATFAVNRRANREADVPQLRAAGKLIGPVDHDVPVLAVRTPQEELLAVVFGYACHATVLDGYQWCGDYPGYAQLALEQAHPECVALFWAGCGADQNPIPRRQVPFAQLHGQALADAVQAVLGQPMQPIEGDLATAYREIDLQLDSPPSREQMQRDAADANRYVAARARMLLSQWDAGQPPSSTYPYPISQWRLGSEVTWVFLGGEVVVDYALKIKAADPRVWVAGYANDVMAYIPSLRVLREGGYEGRDAMVYYGLPSAWAPTVEDQILEEVNRQRQQHRRCDPMSAQSHPTRTAPQHAWPQACPTLSTASLTLG